MGVERSKRRTIFPNVNVDGSEKLSTLFIGKLKKPTVSNHIYSCKDNNTEYFFLF